MMCTLYFNVYFILQIIQNKNEFVKNNKMIQFLNSNKLEIHSSFKEMKILTCNCKCCTLYCKMICTLKIEVSCNQLNRL